MPLTTGSVTSAAGASTISASRSSARLDVDAAAASTTPSASRRDASRPRVERRARS
jgi:hypothetical protein